MGPGLEPRCVERKRRSAWRGQQGRSGEVVLRDGYFVELGRCSVGQSRGQAQPSDGRSSTRGTKVFSLLGLVDGSDGIQSKSDG
jgi:hypothetical protein